MSSLAECMSDMRKSLGNLGDLERRIAIIQRDFIRWYADAERASATGMVDRSTYSEARHGMELFKVAVRTKIRDGNL